MKLMELSRISQKMSMRFIFGVPSWLYYSNVVMMLRLNCLQLVLLGEENFYSISVGYTVVVRRASD